MNFSLAANSSRVPNLGGTYNYYESFFPCAFTIFLMTRLIRLLDTSMTKKNNNEGADSYVRNAPFYMSVHALCTVRMSKESRGGTSNIPVLSGLALSPLTEVIAESLKLWRPYSG